MVDCHIPRSVPPWGQLISLHPSQMCMMKMEGGLIKTGRTEEFNKQFQDNVSLGVLMKLTRRRGTSTYS
jgi:hypothetical protein